MSGKISELEEELAKVNEELEKEKETLLAQTEEIEALKKVWIFWVASNYYLRCSDSLAK